MLWLVLLYVTAALAYGYQDDLNSSKQKKYRCLPTAVSKGPCHTCICNEDQSYHCIAKDCPQITIPNDVQNQMAKECEPNLLYRSDTLWCTCSRKGLWKSNNCRTTFRNMKPADVGMGRLASPDHICESGSFYAVDCHICHCLNGKFNYCTKRNCVVGQDPKQHSCKFGQLLRRDRELCACSHKGVFADNHCIRISNEKYIKLSSAQLKILTDHRKNSTRHACVPNTNIQIDCNRCICFKNGRLLCTDKLCVDSAFDGTNNFLRHGNNTRKDKLTDLPELPSSRDSCTPGITYRHHCNVCYCTARGVPSCTTMLCLDDLTTEEKPQKTKDSDRLSPMTRAITSIEEIHEAEDCEPGHVFKFACNMCKCSQNRSLICTKMACLNSEEEGKLHEFEKKQVNKLKKKPIARNKDSHKKSKKLPKSTKCKPGEIYEKGCQRCFCNDKGVASCTNKPCEDIKLSKFKQVPEDIAPTIHVSQLKNLPALKDQSSECKPGKSYRVDCNACLCLANGNTLCQDKLCPSIEDVNRIKAARYDDQPCKSSSEPAECVKCECKSGKTVCTRTAGCVPTLWRRALHVPVDGTFDPNLDHKLVLKADDISCIPNMVYKKNCNKCYCQEDKSLRCTRKGCLSFTLVQKLKEQRSKLMKHQTE